jgi:pyruvate formate lyase activating enzyme
MNKQLKKILSITAGIIFIVFLALLPQILIQSTVKSVNLAVKLKNDVTQRKTGQPPIATIEPIEKVGLFHFLAGAKTYYLDAIDKDLNCPSCLPGASSTGTSLRPKEQVIADAKSAAANIVSMVDSDSSVTNDYNLNLAKTAKQNGLRTTLTYDACLNLSVLKNILPYLDAVIVKIGDPENNYCANLSGSELTAAQTKIQAIKTAGKHLEIIENLNSTNSTTTEINAFLTVIAASAGKDSIIHFSATDLANTSTTTIIAAREQALRAGFKYVYTGGFDYQQGENTYCADGTIALSRQDDYLLQNNLTSGKCADETVIPGTWK